MNSFTYNSLTRVCFSGGNNFLDLFIFHKVELFRMVQNFKNFDNDMGRRRKLFRN